MDGRGPGAAEQSAVLLQSFAVRSDDDDRRRRPVPVSRRFQLVDVQQPQRNRRRRL